jgi:hypothetical protein
MINKENYKYRLMQLLILILHLVMLKWILYVLSEGGVMTFNTIVIHFAGLALYGASLIRFCAFYFKRRFEKENQ